jgi:hypothetical protein
MRADGRLAAPIQLSTPSALATAGCPRHRVPRWAPISALCGGAVRMTRRSRVAAFYGDALRGRISHGENCSGAIDRAADRLGRRYNPETTVRRRDRFVADEEPGGWRLFRKGADWLRPRRDKDFLITTLARLQPVGMSRNTGGGCDGSCSITHGTTRNLQT